MLWCGECFRCVCYGIVVWGESACKIGGCPLRWVELHGAAGCEFRRVFPSCAHGAHVEKSVSIIDKIKISDKNTVKTSSCKIISLNIIILFLVIKKFILKSNFQRCKKPDYKTK